MNLSTPKEIRECALDLRRDSDPQRTTIGSYASRARAYYCGQQWLTPAASSLPGYQSWTRERTNWVGESGPIRATVNRITKLIIQVYSSTNPERLYVDACPPDHSEGIAQARVADIVESMTNACIDDSGLLQAARRANFERTVAGGHGIGLCMDTWKDVRNVNGVEVVGNNRRIRSFDFDMTRLSLDPANQSTNLLDHEYVLYSEVFTEKKIRRYFGDEVADRIDPNGLQTIGSLMPVEMQFYTLSGGAMYSSYHSHRNSKGARVHFLHVRDPDGTFGRVYPIIEARPKVGTSDGDMVLNVDDPRSPWGGTGLPYVMLWGYMRPGSRMPISDVGMMIDDQDKLNLSASLRYQQFYDWGQWAWVGEKRWFGFQTDEEGIRQQLARRQIIGDNTSKEAMPPQIVRRPEPSPMLSEDIANYSREMQQQVFRSEASQGILKTHVTREQFLGTLEQTELPLDDRVADDTRAYETIIGVLAGTVVMNTALQSPVTGAMLVSAGLSPEDLTIVAQMDPKMVPARIELRQETIRRRSRTQRMQDITNAVQVGAISPEQLAMAMARDLDMPLSSLDKQASRFAKDTAFRVMFGEQFIPRPLGRYTSWLLDEFRRALMSEQARRDPEASKRLTAAIIAQIQMADLESAQAQQAAPGGQAEQPPSDGMATGTLADLANSLQPVS